MQLIVERIEDRVAVLEGEDHLFELPVECLPVGTREGAVLRLEIRHGQARTEFTLAIDAEAQRAREQEIRKLRDSIPQAADGDITL
jgi:ParB-like chromosome segregation protein Spo0J